MSFTLSAGLWLNGERRVKFRNRFILCGFCFGLTNKIFFVFVMRETEIHAWIGEASAILFDRVAENKIRSRYRMHGREYTYIGMTNRLSPVRYSTR